LASRNYISKLKTVLDLKNKIIRALSLYFTGEDLALNKAQTRLWKLGPEVDVEDDADDIKRKNASEPMKLKGTPLSDEKMTIDVKLFWGFNN
jgi:hypothetical protein